MICAVIFGASIGLAIGQREAQNEIREWTALTQEGIDIAKAWQDKYNALADTVIADQQRRIARYDSLKK